MSLLQNIFRWGITTSIGAIALLPLSSAQAATIFTAPELFTRSTIIDFEPEGSGNTVIDINHYLETIGTGTTFSMGGSEARIDDLRDSDRAARFRVASGADGGPVSGNWGFEGGVLGESFLTLTFEPGYFVGAVGSFWGGAVSSYPRARAVATFEDGSTFTAFVRGTLPMVANSATNEEALNGFLGINGNGKLIRAVSFFNNNDLYSQDDVTFGFIDQDSEPQDLTEVPEPASVAALMALLVVGTITKRKA
ncbi:MAG: PEP-CTERM sorting domain-containing protein [Spirulina sp. SIO3F2]|nr:PEP-CTERM sorting domain-containing protein [Spirulina sp. SIO3F2]